MSKKDYTSWILGKILRDQPAEKYEESTQHRMDKFKKLSPEMFEKFSVYFKEGYEKEIELKKTRESRLGQILSAGAIIIALTSTMYSNIPSPIKAFSGIMSISLGSLFLLLTIINCIFIFWFGMKFYQYLQGHSHPSSPDPSAIFKRYSEEIPDYVKQNSLEKFDNVKDFEALLLENYYISYFEWKKINHKREALLYNIQRILYMIIAVSFLTFIIHTIGKFKININVNNKEIIMSKNQSDPPPPPPPPSRTTNKPRK